MKILFVCQSYYPEQFKITDIAETLVIEGHDVTVLTGLPNYPQGVIYPGYRGFKNRNQIINGVKVKRAWLIARGKSKFRLIFNYASFCIAASLKALFDKDKYDIVICYQLTPISMALPAIIIKKKKKIPFILYCLDLSPEGLFAGFMSTETKLYDIAKYFSIKIYKSADKILVSSPMFKKYFNNVLNIKGNIDTLYNYAEDIFIAKKNEFLNKETNILFAGNIGHFQAPLTIAKAAEELIEYKDIKIHIVGGGSGKDDLEAYCNEKGLKNVIFYGYRPLEEMPLYYNKADAMLITLLDDGIIKYTIPNKIQSYMAMGKAILGAVDGGVAKIIEESNCGLYTQAEDHKGLAQIILKFHNLERRDKLMLSENSLKYYKQNYTKTQFISRIEKYIKEEVE